MIPPIVFSRMFTLSSQLRLNNEDHEELRELVNFACDTSWNQGYRDCVENMKEETTPKFDPGIFREGGPS